VLLAVAVPVTILAGILTFFLVLAIGSRVVAAVRRKRKPDLEGPATVEAASWRTNPSTPKTISTKQVDKRLGQDTTREESSYSSPRSLKNLPGKLVQGSNSISGRLALVGINLPRMSEGNESKNSSDGSSPLSKRKSAWSPNQIRMVVTPEQGRSSAALERASAATQQNRYIALLKELKAELDRMDVSDIQTLAKSQGQDAWLQREEALAFLVDVGNRLRGCRSTESFYERGTKAPMPIRPPSSEMMKQASSGETLRSRNRPSQRGSSGLLTHKDSPREHAALPDEKAGSTSGLALRADASSGELVMPEASSFKKFSV